MKRKNLRISFLVAIFLAAFSGCTLLAQIGAGRVDPDQLSKFGGASTDPKIAAADRLFVSQAYQGGLAEIQLGQLAEQKGDSAKVKQLGKTMETDHTNLNAALKQSGSLIGVSMPDKPGKKDLAEYNKLNGLSGAAFDSEYLAYMAKDHKKDLGDYQDEEDRTQNQDLKNTTAKGVAVITAHIKDVQMAGS